MASPTLQVFPPSAENEQLFGEIPGLRQTPIPVVGFDGPDGDLGPEGAGAVLVLHMTMVDEERTQRFWRQVALTCKAASESPGFIRLIAFFDGAANWALGFWKRVEDATAFAKSRPHLEAVKEMHETGFEYTHFAGIFSGVDARPRHAYCDTCGAETVMPAEECSNCRRGVADVFRLQRRQWQGEAARAQISTLNAISS